MVQVHEFQNIVTQMVEEGSIFAESILVGSIIHKLPHSWKGHQKNHKHQKEELSLEKLAQIFKLKKSLDSKIWRMENPK